MRISDVSSDVCSSDLNITIPAEVFPRNVQGTLTGIGGTLGGIAGILSQLSVGWTVQHFSYVPIFIAIGLAYLFMLGCVQFDRQSVVLGKRLSVRVEFGVRRIFKKKNKLKHTNI